MGGENPSSQPNITFVASPLSLTKGEPPSHTPCEAAMTTLETQQQRLSGKVAIVSGAGTFGGSGVGNGAAAAILFARNGAKVIPR